MFAWGLVEGPQIQLYFHQKMFKEQHVVASRLRGGSVFGPLNLVLLLSNNVHKVICSGITFVQGINFRAPKYSFTFIQTCL